MVGIWLMFDGRLNLSTERDHLIPSRVPLTYAFQEKRVLQVLGEKKLEKGTVKRVPLAESSLNAFDVHGHVSLTVTSRSCRAQPFGGFENFFNHPPEVIFSCDRRCWISSARRIKYRGKWFGLAYATLYRW